MKARATRTFRQLPKWAKLVFWVTLLLVGYLIALIVFLRIPGLMAGPPPTRASTLAKAPVVVPLAPALTLPPIPTPTPLPDWTGRHFALAGSVDALALDARAIFALYTPSSDDPHDASHVTLARIDRQTGKVTTSVRFAGGYELLRMGSGLWVLGGIYTDSPSDTFWIDRLDPQTLAIQSRRIVPGRYDRNHFVFPEITGAGNVMWLSNGSQAYRLDPSTAKVLSTRSFAAEILSISIDPSARYLYVSLDSVVAQSDDDLVLQISSMTGATIASTQACCADLGGPSVAGSADGVWIWYATGMMGAVEHRSANGLTLSSQIAPAGSNGVRVYVGPSSVWVTDAGAGRVSCVDPNTRSLDSSAMQLGGPLAADAGNAFVGGQDGVILLKPDTSCFH